jgi:hypothetical protein
MDKLVSFRISTNLPEFRKIFPNNSLDRLWGKFDKIYNRNVLLFYNYLDKINKPFLLDCINKNY